MKYGNHENWCNGTGDCICGEDSRASGERAIRRNRELNKEFDTQADEIRRLKEQVRYWKRKAGAMK